MHDEFPFSAIYPILVSQQDRRPRNIHSIEIRRPWTPKRLISDPPRLKPLQMLPLAAGAHHTEANRPEQPEQAKYG